MPLFYIVYGVITFFVAVLATCILITFPLFIYLLIGLIIKNMTKLELSVAVLATVTLVGLIVLLGLGKDVSILVPTLSALIAFLLGSKKDAIAGVFKK